ncbi:MAG: MCP four helix bundle domain-containing protein [Burkholderiales bacterium]|nr:MCP four helix bundle domain-containing protein [Burkholderiales bacterium]
MKSDSLPLSTKLLLAFGLTSFMSIVMAVAGFFAVRSLDQDMMEIRDRQLPIAVAAVGILNNISYGNTAFNNALLSNSVEQGTKELEGLSKARDGNNQFFKQIESLIQEDDDRRLLDAVLESRKAYVPVYTRFSELIRSGRQEEAKRLMLSEMQATQGDYVAKFDRLREAQMRKVTERTESVSRSLERVLVWLVGIGILALLVAAAAGYWLIRTLGKDLGGDPMVVRTVAQTIAGGDLTVDIPVTPGDRSSVMATMADMRQRLAETLRQVTSSANAVSDAADGVSGMARNVDATAASQSDSTSTVVSAVEQMAVSIQHVSERAYDAEQLAQESGRLSRDGSAVIQSALGEMNAIATAVSDASKEIQQLGQESGQISSIVNVIKEIAEQTNLLALNAAIEAARAGEQGRGFAVVADEVRKLAERTTASTSEITSMVNRIQSGAAKSVANMSAATETVQRGTDMASQAGSAIGGIETAVSQVVTAVSDMAAALREQDTTSQEIARQIERIAQSAESSQAIAGNASRAAEQLAGYAGGLLTEVRRFRVA